MSGDDHGESGEKEFCGAGKSELSDAGDTEIDVQTLLAQRRRDGLALRGQSMNFASPEDVSRTLQAASAGPGLQTFALVDGALLLDMPRRTQRLWRSLESQSLLNGASDDVAAVGPLLYLIEEDQFDTRFPATLCDQTTGRMAGSFIVSDQEPQELARLLSTLVDVQLDDGSDMVMRFFDPRVLPFWIDVLPTADRQHVASGVVRWIFWQHDFGLQTLHFERSPQASARKELPTKLTPHFENALMAACFPYTLIERMRAEDAAALHRVAVPQRYAFFRQQIERAQAHGLNALGELEAYCGTAIEFGATFEENARVRSALGGIKHGQTFDQALATLTQEDWQRVRGPQ